MLKNLLIVFLYSLLIAVKAENVLTIAFGSCFKFYRSHDTDVFLRIQQFNPQYFLWLGDAAYIDYSHTRVKDKFDITNNDKYYAQFKKSVTIKGIYDDHDSNQNNGDKFNPFKESAKQLYLDFIGVDNNSPLRKQDGIYQSFYADQDNQILIVMTDIRYNSDKQTGDSLGENQWKWLEEQFKKKSELIIMTSGIQVMPDDRDGSETWFKWSKKRLYTLIKKYNKPIIFLSGDVHYSEIMKYPCPHRLGQNLYEFTSSGMTFANSDHIPFFGFISQFFRPTTFSNNQDHYYKSNFGILKVITNNRNSPVRIDYETHSSDDSSVVLQKTIYIEELQQQFYDDSQSCILDVYREERQWQNYLLRINESIFIVSCSLLAVLLFIIFLIYNFISYISKFLELYKQIQMNKLKIKQE
ncbi:unnamed protein product (macronuclear) [Paramecium tetraurelia]|uniref:PhoD-like phosphatase metallophosphatase domain-containing protein n=1 Tax=Paramecium tetraurelia TaxID=5888 RepID=A0CID9_PARTE|nr:uncharacterized protein GSPATT00007691001 [Paramecium tetraurelia]CAK70556.1 unnamed protein product [Paramecium tetraurelia]|eukprot:XP_001437953.1 hypothetical protein (macronuclear) [Paramecium tetraurelia strain d4-2]